MPGAQRKPDLDAATEMSNHIPLAFSKMECTNYYVAFRFCLISPPNPCQSLSNILRTTPITFSNAPVPTPFTQMVMHIFKEKQNGNQSAKMPNINAAGDLIPQSLLHATTHSYTGRKHFATACQRLLLPLIFFDDQKHCESLQSGVQFRKKAFSATHSDSALKFDHKEILRYRNFYSADLIP